MSAEMIIRCMGANGRYAGYENMISCLEIIREDPKKLVSLERLVYDSVTKLSETQTGYSGFGTDKDCKTVTVDAAGVRSGEKADRRRISGGSYLVHEAVGLQQSIDRRLV